LALLVAKCLEPHEQVDLRSGESDVEIAEVPLVDELEVLATLLGPADMRRDGVAGRPVLGQTGEHGIAVGEVGVEGTDELALAAVRQTPDDAPDHLARVVLAQENLPQGLDEVLAEVLLGELPEHGVHAVLDEHLPKDLRLRLEPTAQQLDLLLDGD